jgi:hypothetical protein
MSSMPAPTDKPTKPAPEPLEESSGVAFIIVGAIGGLAVTVGMIWAAIKVITPKEKKKKEADGQVACEFH